MIRKYHNHILQTDPEIHYKTRSEHKPLHTVEATAINEKKASEYDPRHYEEKPQDTNSHKTLERQLKQLALSAPSR